MQYHGDRKIKIKTREKIHQCIKWCLKYIHHYHI